MLKLYSLLLLFVSISNFGHTVENGFYLTNDCPCSGYNLTFECTVVGLVGGATVWSGDLINQCSTSVPVFLRHRDFSTVSPHPLVCDDGRLLISSVRAENGCYTSQLNILFSTNLIGQTVACAYDDGSVTTEIGSISIAAILPPTGIHVASANENQLTFAWNPVDLSCSAVQYNIIADNCGICPSSTRHETVPCTDYGATTQGVACSFRLQTVFCEDAAVGNFSEPILVTLRVLEPPIVKDIIHRYAYSTGNAIGFRVQFSAVPSFTIYDGIDGSAVSYTIRYYDAASGGICETATVLASSCVDGVCQDSFSYEDSDCHSPSVGVNVSISIANLLGYGPESDAHDTIVQGQNNQHFSVAFDMVTNSITCTFHGHKSNNKRRVCTIDYGLDGGSCSSNSQTSHSTSDVVRIGLPLRLSSNELYCFSVTGNNGTLTAIVEGTFIPPGDINAAKSSSTLSLELTLTFTILVSFTLITALVVVIVFLVRAYKKIQAKVVNVQARKLPAPSTASTEHTTNKPSHNRIYEEVDSNHAGEVLDVENMAYPRKDFHRLRCATPCSGDSGETDDAYYSTV